MEIKKIRMRPEENFDFKNPDYVSIFKAREERILILRKYPEQLSALKQFYKYNPAQFIIDYGTTFDPTNIRLRLPASIPFILFPKQIDWVNNVCEHWKNSKPLLTEKTRQMGFSWLSVALACTLCLFNEGMTIGFGSRKEEYVDKLGVMKSLLEKARFFMEKLPYEFKGNWNRKTHAPFMTIKFANSNSTIIGEAGYELGRGSTNSIYFVDEAAFLERPTIVEAALSQSTNCRIDISTPNGMDNPFAEKRFSGKFDVFTFHWRDDPRKDDAWYEQQKRKLNPLILAQEVDLDYSASRAGVLIKSEWIQAAIDAHIKLNIEPSGFIQAALDVADEGRDLNAIGIRNGFLIKYIDEWSGKGNDIYHTTLRAFNICDINQCKTLYYDADGLGAGIRGDARIINEHRGNDGYIDVLPFRGSGAVLFPEREAFEGRQNKDFFANLKAQSWWMLRRKFEKTFMYVTQGISCSEDDLISISSSLPNLNRLTMELMQPTYSINNVGKILVDKIPDGLKSPNLADTIMMNFAPAESQGLNLDIDAIRSRRRW